MEDIHEIFTRFKKEFPGVYTRHEALGKEIHEKAGLLPENSRWLIKMIALNPNNSVNSVNSTNSVNLINLIN